MNAPRQIGPYRIIKKLGAGATASTYLAMECVTDATTLLACLKIPHRAYAGDRQFIEGFLREARIAAKLHHPNIVQLKDVCDERGLRYLAYDFVEGMDLAELISAVRAENAQLDWLLVAFIALAIARALEHAHEDLRGSGRTHEHPPVVHRDLAPSNILLGLSGSGYVTDFGLARAMDRAWLLASGQRGRIAYCAPEYLLGQPYDARADLYSFGVILFEALTGHRPFPAIYMHQRNEHLDHVMRRARPPVRALRYELHPSFGAPPPDGLLELARVTDRLLEPIPADRIQTAAELVDALGAIALPSNMDRELRDVVQRYQPAERRSIRATATEHPASGAREWSITGPQHVQRHLIPRAVFDSERDGVRLSAEGAARLFAAFASEGNDSLGDTLSALAQIDPDRAPITLDATDPDRPAFDAYALDATPPIGAADPIIPSTRPGLPVVTATISSHALTGVAHASDAVDPVPTAAASSASLPMVSAPPLDAAEREPRALRHLDTSSSLTRQSPAFAQTHYTLPSLDPTAIEGRSRWALRLAAPAITLAVLSLFVLSTASTLLVPLIKGELGYQIIDHFWTPLFTYGALAALVLAFVLAIVAFGLWRKDRTTQRTLSR